MAYGNGKSRALKDNEQTRALISAINAEEENSYSSDTDSELSADCARNIDRYLGRNTNPAPDGRSQVRDRSVYETVQWIQPSLSRIFANGDNIVDLPPVGEEDIEGAKQETEYLNHVILTKNNWFEIFDTASKDALICKRAYLYVYSEVKRSVEIECYKKQTPESLGLILDDDVQVVSQEEYPDPDYKPEPQPMLGQDGRPMLNEIGQPLVSIPPPPMLYNVEIRRTKKEQKYCIEALPPERCKVSEKSKDVQVADSCPYFEYYDFPTLSDLRQSGFDVDDDLSSVDTDDSLEDTARNQYSQIHEDDASATDPAMKRVKCRYIWVRHDFDQDGIAELQYVVMVGSNVLHREECSRIPIGVLCPEKLPHRHIGQCPADTVGELEEIKTVILRQGLDNLYLSNNPQKYGDPTKVNLDDMMVSRPGGVWRTRQGAIFGNDFGVLPIPFVFPQAMEGLEYMDQIKENRAGVNRYFTGIDQNALNKTKGGMEMLSTMSAQRVEQIARHYANGIEVTCSLMHECILKSGHKKEVVQLRNQWVTVDPTTWRRRTDFKISVGYAAGNKDQLVQRLMLIANAQKEAMAGGLPIVNARNIYETAIELTKATDMQGPKRFWQDPADAPPPQPPQPDPTVVAMEQIKTQSAEKIKAAEIDQKNYECSKDNEVEVFKARLEAETKLQIAGLQAQHQRELEAQKGDQSVGIEQIRAQLNPKNIEAEAKAKESATAADVLKALADSQQQQTQIILKAFEELTKAMSAPRVIDRDPKTQKAIGSRIASV